jgi:c-di-GMP-binding flagellar brake protein YcgR
MIWYLEKPVNVRRVQMRRFVRVPMALPLTVKLPGEHGSLHNAAEATLVDISGGGLCFATQMKSRSKVRIAVDIPNLPLFGTLRTFAQVERCTAIEVFNGKIYHIGASLENSLSKKEQEKLIQCIFELQRKYLQKRAAHAQYRSHEKTIKLKNAPLDRHDLFFCLSKGAF